MTKVTVKVLDINKSCVFATLTDGSDLYNILVKYIMNNQKLIVVDFEGIDVVISDAIEYSIGKLYTKFDKKDLKYIEYVNASDETSKIISNEIKIGIKKRLDYKKYIKEHPEAKEWLDPLK